MTFKLTDVLPNPFRALNKLPLDQTKVDKLMENIKATGFDGNVLGRVRAGKLELAYGHHRVEALKQLKFESAEFIVAGLSDDEMLSKMVSDNDPAYSHGIGEIIEGVRATVLAFAEGKIKLADIDKHTKREYIRYAPSFIAGLPAGLPGCTSHAYTAMSVAEKIGLTESDGQDKKRARTSVHAALAVLMVEDFGIQTNWEHGLYHKVIGLSSPTPIAELVSADYLLREMNSILERAARGLVTARINHMTASAAVVEGQRQLDAQAAVFKAKQTADAVEIQQMAQLEYDANKEEDAKKMAAYRAKQAKEKLRVKAFAKERRELEEKLEKRKQEAETARKAEAKLVKAAALHAAKNPQPYMPHLTELLVYLEAGLPKCAAQVIKDKGRLTTGQKQALEKALGQAGKAISAFWKQIRD